MKIADGLIVVMGLVAAMAYPAHGDSAKVDPKATTTEVVKTEAQWIDQLKAAKTWTEKQEACRGLRRVGTATCVPVVAPLLKDDKMSHFARYVLEPIPGPEAGKALRDALATAAGLEKAGMADSVGVRRDAEAISLMVPMLADPNPDIVKAAAVALGHIGTPEAAKALMDAAAKSPEPLRPFIGEGALLAGEHLVQDKHADIAATMYKTLQSAPWPQNIRLGAFEGIAAAQPAQAHAQLLEALAGSDPLLRDFAAHLISQAPAKDTSAAYAADLAKLPAAGQIALLRALAIRKDPAARPAVLADVDSTDVTVRATALRTAGAVGGAQDVTKLASLLTDADANIASAARDGLRGMKGKDVDAALGAALAAAAPPVQVQSLALLTDHMAPQAIPIAVDKLKSQDAAVRDAALHTLAQMGTKDQAPVVIATLKAATDADVRGGAAKALNAIAKTYKDEALPAVLDGMKDANPEARVALLQSLDRIGGKGALDAAAAAVKDPNAQIQIEAARVLSNWHTAEAAPELLELAKSSNENIRDLGLRGYVRMAREETALDKKTAMLKTVTPLAKDKAAKFAVLGAWGTVPTEEALQVLTPYLDDPEVHNEAAAAIVGAATEFGKGLDQAKGRAGEAVKAAAAKSDSDLIKNNAQAFLATLK